MNADAQTTRTASEECVSPAECISNSVAADGASVTVIAYTWTRFLKELGCMAGLVFVLKMVNRLMDGWPDSWWNFALYMLLTVIAVGIAGMLCLATFNEQVYHLNDEGLTFYKNGKLESVFPWSEVREIKGPDIKIIQDGEKPVKLHVPFFHGSKARKIARGYLQDYRIRAGDVLR